jgi:hypothetical protein
MFQIFYEGRATSIFYGQGNYCHLFIDKKEKIIPKKIFEKKLPNKLSGII